MPSQSIVVLFLLLSQIASADILFLDLNNSPKEIEAAQVAAKQRGEKLIVFPDKPTDYRTDFSSQLSTKLQEMKKDKIQSKISSVIISGHNGNGHFTGSKADLSYVELQKIIQSNPELAESVDSLYLWGCYTATPGSIISHWKPTFKNLNVIIGYDGVAPANNSLSGHKFLTDALIKEKKMTIAKTDNELKSIFNDLAHVRNIDASICVSETYVSKKKFSSLNKLMEQCNVEESKKWAEVYDCYMDGVKPELPEYQGLDCSDVPTNTSNSKLRDLYNYLQDTSHCDDMIKTHGRNRDEIIRLIFSKNVIKNFLENNKECNSHINSFLADSGRAVKVDVQDLLNSKRSEIKKKSSEIAKAVRSEIGRLEMSLSEKINTQTETVNKLTNAHLASRCVSRLDDINYLNPETIPFSWVEPKSNDNSKYESVKDMRKRIEKSTVEHIANEYAYDARRKSGVFRIISKEDEKKFQDTIRNQWANQFSSKSVKEFQAQKGSLNKKYFKQIEAKTNQIIKEIPPNTDRRVREEIIKSYLSPTVIFNDTISRIVQDTSHQDSQR